MLISSALQLRVVRIVMEMGYPIIRTTALIRQILVRKILMEMASVMPVRELRFRIVTKMVYLMIETIVRIPRIQDRKTEMVMELEMPVSGTDSHQHGHQEAPLMRMILQVHL